MLRSLKFKLILVLIVCTVFAYASSLGNPFIWDDDQFITNNIYVQRFRIVDIFTQNTTAGGGVVSNYYRPLTSLSFAIDNQLWGKNPFPFHTVNLLLHIAAGVVLFLVIGALGMGELSAFFVSLFFLVFPTQTEAVSYINSRGDSMFAVLFLLSLYLFIRALGKRYHIVEKEKKHLSEHQLRIERRTGRFRSNLLMLGSVVLYGLSILAKETALFGLPLYGVTLWMYGNTHGKNLKTLLRAPQWIFFATVLVIAIIYFLLRLTVLNFANILNFYNVPDVYSSHLYVRIFTFCKILFIYLGILLFPYPLHMERDVRYITTFFNGWVIGAILIVCCILSCGVLVSRKTRNFWVVFGFLWSTIFLFPISGIIPINGLLYEHWLYLPMIGFWIMAYGIAKFTIYNFQFSNKFLQTVRKMFLGLGVLLAGIYIILTIHQNNIWADPVTFYRYTLQFAPQSYRLHNNLGISLAAVGDNRGAIEEYRKTIQLKPDNEQVYNNLGFSYFLLGQYGLAEKNLLYALKLSPDFFLPRGNLVKVYLMTHQYDKARKISGNNPIVETLIKKFQAQDTISSGSAH